LGRERINSLFFLNIMRSQTVIIVRWKLSDRIEVFVNLGKLYDQYNNNELGVSRWTLDRKDLFNGYENDTILIMKTYIK
jgi:hypothetical protein